MTDAWDAADPGTDAQSAQSVDAWDKASPTEGLEHTAVSETPHTTIPEIAKNIGAGALSGATDIGSTLLWPVDTLRHAMDQTAMSPSERRASLKQFYSEKADPNSLAFKAGKLGGMVAGTAGVGPALGAGAEALGAPAAVSNALSSGGMSLGGETTGSMLGNAALKTGAGAAVGGLSAGMINPSTAGTGAVIGAATPGTAYLLGLAGHGAGWLAGKGASTLLGATTGTGKSAVEAAYQAGVSGDHSFIDNMRGNVGFGDIVDQAKDALNVMRDARGATYKEGMSGISQDKTALDMGPIIDAVKSAQDRFGTYNGEVVNENANSAISKVADKVNDWATKEPTIFHTPLGLDKLKQWVGGELENAKPGTQTDAALKGIYNSIKGTISEQAPDYAHVMQQYSDASEQLNEISRSLSLGSKASVDTSVRKLQSILRNNVTTNFGNRASSIDALESQGGANLRSALAGQSMSSVWPRGIAGAVDAAAAVPAAITHPGLLAAGVAASPRIVGEAAYGLGKTAGAVSNVIPKNVPLNALIPILGSQKAMRLSDLMNAYRENADRNPATSP